MPDESKDTDVPEYQFDIDEMPITNQLVEAHQEGNFLVGRTERGVTFRQRIPTNKMLSQNDKGEWTLVDLVHVE